MTTALHILALHNEINDLHEEIKILDNRLYEVLADLGRKKDALKLIADTGKFALTEEGMRAVAIRALKAAGMEGEE